MLPANSTDKDLESLTELKGIIFGKCLKYLPTYLSEENINLKNLENIQKSFNHLLSRGWPDVLLYHSGGLPATAVMQQKDLASRPQLGTRGAEDAEK